MPRVLAFYGARVLFGQERSNIETLAVLKDHGCEVLCLVRDEAWNQAVADALTVRGLATEPVPYLDGWLAGYRLRTVFRNPVVLVRANLALRRIIRRFEPTHLYCFNPWYAATFMPALFWSRVPMIYRIGDQPTVHRWVWRRLWAAVAGRTAVIVANSQFVKRSVEQSGVAAEKVRVIYSVPPRREAVAPCELPASCAGPGRFRITYVGQLTAHKGVDVLVDAFARVAGDYPDARLLIAGRMTEWAGDQWARDLRDRVERDPSLQRQVCFLGFVEDVPGLLNQSHLHACPSIFEEPLALAVVEAKAQGRASIVFPRGGLPELVRHGRDGWVCPEPSVDALAEALRHYLAHPEDASAQGREARAWVERSARAFAPSWLAALDDAARARA